MTNYERIKNMSVEEMASFLSASNYGECECCPMNYKDCDCSGTDSEVEKWLESEWEQE